MGRAWGYWTVGKLDLLGDYLDAFTTASKRAGERIYLDVFAGVAENEERHTGREVKGSARIALSVDSPPFTRFRFFELPNKARELDASLRADFPSREFQVVAGDCNDEIEGVLRSLKHLAWAPTFAFVDPDGMEAKWQTLEALAEFRQGQKTKVELFLLFAAPMFTRLLPIDGTPVRAQDAETIDAIYGSEDWRAIYRARLEGWIEPSEARDDYLNLMRWRIERILGYRWTHPLEIKNERGAPIYYMIFATDHEAGTKIMSDLFAKAAARFPAMRESARRERARRDDEARGVHSLFAPEDREALQLPPQEGERFYEHVPPTRPRTLADYLGH